MADKFVEVKQGSTDIHVTMGVDDWQEIVINNEFHLHIRTDDSGAYSVDVYKYSELEEPLEDDLIHSFWASRDDLITELNVKTLSNDGTDRVNETDTEFYLLGNKVYKDENVVGSDIASNEDIIEAIEKEVDKDRQLLVSVELDGEAIFEDDELIERINDDEDEDEDEE